MRLAGEPGHLTDPGQQPGSTRRADPVQVSQGSAGGPEQRAEFLVRLLLALVDPFQVADQLGGDPAAGLARGIAGADRASSALAWAADRFFFAPPGISPGSS